jgi:hypothetical protein
MKAYKITTGLAGLSDFLHSEYDSTYNTDRRVLLAGSGAARVIPALALVAAVFSAAPAVAAGAVVGTGNGAIGAVTGDVGAQPGLYQVVVIEPAANGGAFEVIRPDGVVDGTGNIGAAYNGSVNFTLADGSTDFVAGDRIPLTLAYGNTAAKIVRWDPTAVNGAQTIVGVNCFDAEAPNGVDDWITILARGPLVGRREAIVFHAGATDAQKSDAYAQLKALGIECRRSG